MKKSLDLWNAIQIPKPCPANWADMIGDDYTRYCGICAKHVYNLSALNADDAAALLQAKEGDVCVRLYKRLDGTVMTADCQPPTTGNLVKHLTTATAFAASLFVAGCGVSEPNDETPQAQPNAAVNHPDQCVMGEPMMGSPAPPAVMGRIDPREQPAPIQPQRIDDSKEVLTIEPREVGK